MEELNLHLGLRFYNTLHCRVAIQGRFKTEKSKMYTCCIVN